MTSKIKLWIGVGAYLLTNAGAATAMPKLGNEIATDEIASLTQLSNQTVNLLASKDEAGKDETDDKDCKDDKDSKDCKADKGDEGGEGGEGGEG